MNISKFMAKISKYAQVSELTVEMVNKLINMIVSHKTTITKSILIIQIDIILSKN
ncbi:MULTISPECIES: DUF4368 domain-containing protein [unclassified Gemella]|uniref:DUF4368 domain-containing protein n=1 Tax=unclassified Gemella TaxID=2624949 RepID=UPI001C043E10|nr:MULTISPECIES: DUF4368 domain-containing protein [unclassified Gemella]MBU0278085.1 DUF4368 domain-containing protein [Gemella sp. zg-1178]QWQ38389.1 DUF4368 domain-containing protein [Gemella sp. zg-570]